MAIKYAVDCSHDLNERSIMMLRESKKAKKTRTH